MNYNGESLATNTSTTGTDGITVSNNTLTLGTDDTEINDCNLMLCADNDTSDSKTSGFFSKFNSSGVKYAGIGRYHSDGSYYVYKDTSTEPSSTTDLSSLTRADFNCGALDSNGQITASSLRTATIDSKAGTTTIDNETVINGDLTVGGDLTFSAAADATIQSTLTHDMIIGNNTVSSSDNAHTRYYDAGTIITTAKNMILFSTDSGGVVFTDSNGSISSNTIKNHGESTSNPHSVTAAQIGLNSIDSDVRQIQGATLSLVDTISTTANVRNCFAFGKYLAVARSSGSNCIMEMYSVIDPENITPVLKKTVTIGVGGTQTTEFMGISGDYLFGTVNGYGGIVYNISNPDDFIQQAFSVFNDADIIGFTMSGRYAYAIFNTATQTCKVYDLFQPTPVEVGSVNLTGRTQTANARLLYDRGYVYFAPTAGGGTNSGAIWIIDVSDPAVPTNAQGITYQTGVNYVADFAISDGILYSADQTNELIYKWNIADPYVPVQLAVSATMNSNNRKIDLQGSYLICGGNSGTSKGIYIVDTNDLAILSSYTSSDSFLGVRQQGRYIYGANQTDNTITIVKTNDLLAYSGEIANLETFRLNCRENAYVGRSINAPFINCQSISSTGDSVFDGNVRVNGDLQLSGSTSVVGFSDPTMSIDSENTAADTTTSGIYSSYNSSGVKYAGLMRNGGGDFYIIEAETSEPTGSTDPTASTLASLHLGGVIVNTSTPASSGATGVAGTITWDASYIYVCTATNTWRRTFIATW